MASLVKSLPHVHPLKNLNPSQSHLSTVILSFPLFGNPLSIRHGLFALKTCSDGRSIGYGSDWLGKPVISKGEDVDEGLGKIEESEGERDYEDDSEEEKWVDWEDQILEDTVPLVGFVRMILHSGIYLSGEKLSPDHERTITEKLLPFHPESEKKIGCGVDYITIGYHPNFESSRCLFIMRKDGQLVDFSYWKCIKGLIRKNYPLYADSFILRHFRRRRRNL